MLHILRQKTIQRYLFIALCILIIPGFVLMSSSLDQSGISGTAGQVGNRKISAQEFIRNYEAMRRELEIFGGVDPSTLDGSIDYESLAWQRILLVGAAKESGLRISDAEVVEWIQRQKVFEDKGVYSPERYKLIVDRYLKMDPKAFEEEVREFLSLQKYRDQIRGEFKADDAELRERFRQLYGPRELDYVILTKESVPAPTPATNEELKDLYDRLSGRLFSQESVQVRYLTAPAEGAAPADAGAAEWDAKAVRVPFISKEEVIPGIGAAPKLSEVIFGLKKAGDKTGWLEHEGKRYRFELIEHRAQTPMTFDEAKKVLEELAGQHKMILAVTEKASAFRKKLDTASWPDAVAEEKLTALHAAAFVPGDYLDKVGKLPRIDQVLAELDVTKISDPLPTSNGLAIFRVASQADPDATKFEAHRKELEADLRLKHEIKVFTKAMKALESTLKTNPTVLAKLFPTKYSETPASK
jgi:hypothetical protein